MEKQVEREMKLENDGRGAREEGRAGAHRSLKFSSMAVLSSTISHLIGHG